MEKDLIAIEVDEQNRITRALDMSTPRPIEVPGGDVVFADELARTDDDQALSVVGDRPIASTSIYSETDVRNALAAYDTEYVTFALKNTITGTNGTRAARIAESGTHDHPAAIESAVAGELALTDGGVATESTSEEPTNAERGVQTAYRATCHDWSWTRTRTDVVEADELGAEHYREQNHLTETIEVETAASPARSETADFGGGEGGVDEL